MLGIKRYRADQALLLQLTGCSTGWEYYLEHRAFWFSTAQHICSCRTGQDAPVHMLFIGRFFNIVCLYFE
jgi:hypothetical protein